MEKTWKPTTAGILSIISGALGVIAGIVIAGLGGLVAWLLGTIGLPDLSGIVLPGLHTVLPAALKAIVALVAAIPLVLGIVAIVGGVYALKRKKWGLRLLALFAPCSASGCWGW